MGIQVLYFAAAREQRGLAKEHVELCALGSTQDLAAFWTWLEQRCDEASTWKMHMRLAVNQEFVDAHDLEYVLCDGDEVAIIPPVSGGSGCSCEHMSDARGLFVVTQEVLDPRAIEALVMRDGAGALVTFAGHVRDHTGDRQVSYLVYEAYVEMALHKLVETAQEAIVRWPDVHVAIHHRHGRLEIGEAAVVIAVSNPHRAGAFAACAFVIERLKEVVPIWKKEVGLDDSIWVGKGP